MAAEPVCEQNAACALVAWSAHASDFPRRLVSYGSSLNSPYTQVITEIGNALGYVRMVRSGGLHHCSNAIKFVPDLENIVEFAPIVAAQSLAEETKAAAKCVFCVFVSRWLACGVPRVC